MKYEQQEMTSRAKTRWGIYTGKFFGGFGGYHQVLDDPVLNDVFGRELEYPNFARAKRTWGGYKKSNSDPADVLMNPHINAFFRCIQE